MIKSLKTMTAAIVMTSAICSTGLHAQEDTATEAGLPFDIGFGVDLATNYNWRGVEFNDEPVAQPWIDISKSFDSVFSEGDSLTIGFNWWGNYDFTDGGRDDNFSEYDWTPYLSYSTGAVTIDAGLIYYYFPGIGGGDGADTAEVFLGFSYDCLLQPSLTVYYDFDDGEGFYVNFGLGHSFALTENLSLDLGADVGWADSDMGGFIYGSDSAGFTNVHGSVGLSYAVNENFDLGVTYHGSAFIDEADDAADAASVNDTYTWGVVSASFSF